MRKLTASTVLLATLATAILACTASDASAAEKAVVNFRLAKKKTLHLHNEKTAKSYHASLKKLGCDCKLGQHNGHYDLTFACPTWRKAEFDTHDSAHKWQAWLKKLGFETSHKH